VTKREVDRGGIAVVQVKAASRLRAAAHWLIEPLSRRPAITVSVAASSASCCFNSSSVAVACGIAAEQRPLVERARGKQSSATTSPK
jgi:hypothetical protein